MNDSTSSLDIEYVPTDSLVFDPAHARVIDDLTLDSLGLSVREFGLVQPVVARRQDRVIIAGHQRVKAARREGLGTIPIYGGLADNSVGRVIERLLRHDLVIIDDLGFAPLDDVGSQLLFRFVAAAYEHRSLGLASHWPFESWGRFLPEHTTAVAMLDRLLHHATTVVTSGDSYRMKEARARGGALLPTT